MTKANQVYVLDYDSTEDEHGPGAGSIRRIITRGKTGMDLTFSKGRIAPGAGQHWHAHEIQAEAVFVLEGEGTMHIEGQGDVA